jgi:ribosomal protein L40E
MGWEHDDYGITCKACGHTGSLRLSSDDNNNFEAEWGGFAEIRSYHMNPAGSLGRCRKCGSTDIKIGGLPAS